jgi:hypothetical protein
LQVSSDGFSSGPDSSSSSRMALVGSECPRKVSEEFLIQVNEAANLGKRDSYFGVAVAVLGDALDKLDGNKSGYAKPVKVLSRWR